MADHHGRAARPFLELSPLIKAVGIAGDARKLVLASLGLLALKVGWDVLEGIFGGSGPFWIPLGGWGLAFGSLDGKSWENSANLVAEPAMVVVRPFVSLFTRGNGAMLSIHSGMMAVWSVVVWGIFGGAIARIAVVQASTGRKIGIGTALRFGFGKSGSLIVAPLTPMLAVGLFAAICAGFGLIYRIPGGVGSAIASILWFLPLLIGLMMALVLVGLALGWPLMHATVAAEGEDAPDALSRSYSYINQRLPRYVAHLAVSWALGALGLVVVALFARIVLGLSSWGVGLGAPTEGNLVPGFWFYAVAWLVHAWIYSYFWSATSTIYLILRKDVDGTEWHDVYLPEHDADTFAPEVEPSDSTEVPRVA